jgi:hypothetical protein
MGKHTNPLLALCGPARDRCPFFGKNAVAGSICAGFIIPGLTPRATNMSHRWCLGLCVLVMSAMVFGLLGLN